MTENRSEPREIPIRDSSNGKPVVTTLIKFTLFLAAILVPVVTAALIINANRFETIVEKHFADFKLELVREYATKAETLTRREYDIRHDELIQQDKAMSDRISAAERRMDQLNERMVAIERRH